MDTIEDAKQLIRRRHSAALKAQVLAECSKPGASVARIAMAHGLNANLVHKWRRLASAPVSAPSFIPLPLAPSPTVQAPARDLVIELQQGALAIKVTWPVSAAPACAAYQTRVNAILRAAMWQSLHTKGDVAMPWPIDQHNDSIQNHNPSKAPAKRRSISSSQRPGSGTS